MSTYQFEVLDPELVGQLVPLRIPLGVYSRSADVGYLTWKYLNNPYMTDPLIYVARSEGRVVAMRGTYGTSWVVPGLDRPLVLPCSADTAIAAEHRSSGLFADLTDFMVAGLADHGYRYVVNMGATPANHIASIVNLGWHKVGSYEPLIRATRPVGKSGPAEVAPGTNSEGGPLVRRLKRSRQLRRFVGQIRTVRRNTFGPGPFDVLDQRLGGGIGDASLLVTAEPQPEAMARLAERFDDPRRIHHLRDERYIVWRYGNPLAFDRWSPIRLHRRFFFLGGGNGEAYAVFQGNPGRPTVHIVDWAGDEAALIELIRTAIAMIKPAQLRTWGATLSGPITTELARSGFVADERGPQTRWQGLLLKELSSSGAVEPTLGNVQILDMDSWNLRMIQSDATE